MTEPLEGRPVERRGDRSPGERAEPPAAARSDRPITRPLRQPARQPASTPAEQPPVRKPPVRQPPGRQRTERPATEPATGIVSEPEAGRVGPPADARAERSADGPGDGPGDGPTARRRVLRRSGWQRFVVALGALGPGLVAANAGNDAGGIATYASVGAAFGYALLWAMIPIAISLAMVQEMAGRMGAVTGKGFADLVREQLGVRVTAFVMATLIVANSALVVSEFAGIGAASELFGVPRVVSVPSMALVIWWLVTRGSYERVEKVFLALTLAFFAYPVAAILAHPEWGVVGRSLVHPTLRLDTTYVTFFIALVGTSITPYMQLYIQSSVAERGRGGDVASVRLDAYGGTAFSMLTAGFIIVATGATLFAAGQEIETADDAARALVPIAGQYAGMVFGAGLFGASTLAAAVLPLATAYTVTEAFGFEKGVSFTFGEAPIFNGLFTGLLVLGAALALWPSLNVIELLIYAQVVNGLLLPVVLITILRLVNDREVMGRHVNGRLYNLVGWTLVAFVAALSTVYLLMTILGQFGLSLG
ncbi:MAG: divalent metal cation transporter [Chloroflexi bacterium]|nr:divalent metal cation transporter [Chloroflexota bacterium]